MQPHLKELAKRICYDNLCIYETSGGLRVHYPVLTNSLTVARTVEKPY